MRLYRCSDLWDNLPETRLEREYKMRVLVKTTSFIALFTLVTSIKYRIPMTDFHDLF